LTSGKTHYFFYGRNRAERLEQEAKQAHEAKRQEKIRKMEEQEAADESMLLGPSSPSRGKSMFDE